MLRTDELQGIGDCPLPLLSQDLLSPLSCSQRAPLVVDRPISLGKTIVLQVSQCLLQSGRVDLCCRLPEADRAEPVDLESARNRGLEIEFERGSAALIDPLLSRCRQATPKYGQYLRLIAFAAEVWRNRSTLTHRALDG